MYPGVHAQTRSEHRALVMADGTSITYGELDRRSTRLAHALRARGLRAGGTLAIVMENRVEWAEAMWAGMRSGVHVAPLNSHLTAGELSYLLADSGAAAVITSERCEDAVADALAQAGTGAAALAAGGRRLDDLDAAITGAPDGPLADERLGARMLYSSGTTGRPKGIRQPLKDVHPADAPPRLGPLMDRLEMTPDVVFLSPAPNYHAAPFTFMLVVQMLGGTVVSMPRFDAVEVLRLIERERVTHAQFVPTMLTRLDRLDAAEREGHDLSSLRVAMTSGAPCPPALKERILDWWGPVLHEYYGASEGYGQTHVSPHEARERPGTVGRAVAGTIHITDDEGTELPVGEVGRVWFDGTAPVAYHGDAAKSAAARHPRGWSTVGDIGRLDADGFLFLAGRESHTIISGGVNVYPQEIEDVLGAHPHVADVAVIGVPDDDLGEKVIAVVVTEPDAPPAEELDDALVALCRERLAGFKRPKRFDHVEALPRTPTGKLLKDEVRRAYWPAPA
jgi:long-chain acyl-CoA synthetase